MLEPRIPEEDVLGIVPAGEDPLVGGVELGPIGPGKGLFSQFLPVEGIRRGSEIRSGIAAHRLVALSGRYAWPDIDQGSEVVGRLSAVE